MMMIECLQYICTCRHNPEYLVKLIAQNNAITTEFYNWELSQPHNIIRNALPTAI